MNVLVVGSGAREHALAWKIAQSKDLGQLFSAPGNAGTAALGTNWPDVAAISGPALVRQAKQASIDLAIIGPEGPLAAGVAEALREAGIAVFGPDRDGARLEASKAHAKQFMERYGIPTARYRVAHDQRGAERHLAHWPERVVLKADGLAAGKGVVVCASAEEARVVLAQWYGQRALPGGGTDVVIEEALEGPEVSVLALLDGRRYALLDSACDYKRAGDGDSGPNTGGMGAYSPAQDVMTRRVLDQVRSLVFDRVLDGLRQERVDYRGCLYAGLMITQRGPMVLEFNARFGDPETQALVPRVGSDLLRSLHAAANGAMHDDDIPSFIHKPCVAVVLASEGYPLHAQPVYELPSVDAEEGVTAFWGASQRSGNSVSSRGGRVLTMCALGDDMEAARQRAYAACSAYESRLPPGVRLHYRRDIAGRVAAAAR